MISKSIANSLKMKQVVFFLFFSVFLLAGGSTGVFAQVKWAPKGAKWYYTRPYYNQNNPGNDTNGDCVVFESLGDTTINGRHAIALEVRFCAGKNISKEIISSSGDTLFYLNNGKFYPLYNFAAKAGDTVTVHTGWFYPVKACLFYSDSVNGFRYKITAVDSVEISGRWLKRQTVDRISQDWGFFGGTSRKNYIIEKLGSLTYFFGRYSTFIPEESVTLLRCYSDSAMTYHNPAWGSVCDLAGTGQIKKVRNLVVIGSNVLSVRLKGPQYNARMYLYDINGQLLFQHALHKGENTISLYPLQTGIYFLKVVTPEGLKVYKFFRQ